MFNTLFELFSDRKEQLELQERVVVFAKYVRPILYVQNVGPVYHGL